MGFPPVLTSASFSSVAYSVALAISKLLLLNWNPSLAVKFTTAFPSVPCLVVTIITPLAPREPYMAVADASFSTSIDSMSCVLRKEMSSINIPSTT